MASGNLFLGTASRSVGDVTMYVSKGQQRARVRRRNISNPRSVLQVASRVTLATTSRAYQVMSSLLRESFQGRQPWEAQARFQYLNNRLLRQKWMRHDGFNSPDTIPNNVEPSYVRRDWTGAVANGYYISEGSLLFQPGTYIDINDTIFWGFISLLEADDISTITYGDVCARLGCQMGDQLTFVDLFVNDVSDDVAFGQVSAFEYARIVMSPSSGDSSTPFFSATGSLYQVNSPNSRNKGSLVFGKIVGSPVVYVSSLNGKEILMNDELFTTGAIGVILSRNVGNGWLYSTCQLAVNENAVYISAEATMFGAAVESWLSGGTSEGTLYLQAAERGF